MKKAILTGVAAVSVAVLTMSSSYAYPIEFLQKVVKQCNYAKDPLARRTNVSLRGDLKVIDIRAEQYDSNSARVVFTIVNTGFMRVPQSEVIVTMVELEQNNPWGVNHRRVFCLPSMMPRQRYEVVYDFTAVHLDKHYRLVIDANDADESNNEITGSLRTGR